MTTDERKGQPPALHLLAGLATQTAAYCADPAQTDGLRAHILDTLGLIAAGADTPTTRRLKTVPGFGDGQVHPSDVAFLFAAAADAMALDDFDEETRLHPGAPVVSAILAATHDATPLAAFEKAAAAGYAVALSLGTAIESHKMHDKGAHPSSIIGAMAAAAAVSTLRGRDMKETARSIGIAASLSAGIFELDPANTIRSLQMGNAAAIGVRADDMAHAGFEPNANCLDGPKGWFRRNDATPEAARDRLGRESAEAAYQRLIRVGFKPYAHFTDINPATALLISMMLEGELKADDIRQADFQLKPFVGKKLTPGFPPANRKEAMRSLPWVMACILDRDRPSLTDPMTTALSFDAERAQRLSPLAERISWRADLAVDAPIAGRLQLTLSDGRMQASEIAGYPGDGRQTDLRWGLDDVRTRLSHLGAEAATISETYSDIVDQAAPAMGLAKAVRTAIFGSGDQRK